MCAKTTNVFTARKKDLSIVCPSAIEKCKCTHLLRFPLLIHATKVMIELNAVTEALRRLLFHKEW